MRVLAESTVDSSAPPAAVWAVWADAGARPSWHPGLVESTLDGPVAAGTTGRWTSARARRPVDVEVTRVVPGERLELTGTHGHGPRLAQGRYEHVVAPLPGGGSRLTHRMSLSGLLAVPIGLALGRMLAVSASPDAVRAVARLAEARS